MKNKRLSGYVESARNALEKMSYVPSVVSGDADAIVTLADQRDAAVNLLQRWVDRAEMNGIRHDDIDAYLSDVESEDGGAPDRSYPFKATGDGEESESVTAAPSRQTGMTFADAVAAMKAGRSVHRKRWMTKYDGQLLPAKAVSLIADQKYGNGSEFFFDAVFVVREWSAVSIWNASAEESMATDWEVTEGSKQ